MNNMIVSKETNYVEIPKEAFWLMVGNDEKSWREYDSTDEYEWSLYEGDGVTLMALCHFETETTRYFVSNRAYN